MTDYDEAQVEFICDDLEDKIGDLVSSRLRGLTESQRAHVLEHLNEYFIFTE